MANAVYEFTDANFKTEVLAAPTVVLVDFWAVWCGPCKAIAPVIEELARELGGKARIGKVNVDENPEITRDCNIFNIPTVIFFKNGVEASRMVGLHSKADLLKKIEGLSR
ncbi:MAG: thioredoxin [Candidatus Omnitrophota bacterium]